MIFKRWFKPKWQHQDAAVRMAAINALDDKTTEQKEILHELAFNDGTESVRRAALSRLNEFSLWWQASKHDNADRLRQFAEQQLVDMLLKNQVSAQLKKQFIAECQRSSVLEKLAQTEQDTELRLQLLHRLERQDLYLQALVDTNLPLQQRQMLLEKIADDKALERLLKQTDEAMRQAISLDLQRRQEVKARPERLRRTTTLLLARLNAVREKTDAALAEQEFATLSAQWQQIVGELSLLPPEEQLQLQAKYEKISQLTTAALAPRLAQLAREQAALVQQQARQQLLQQLEEQLAAIEQQLGELLSANQLTELEPLGQALTSWRQQLAADLPATTRDKLLARADQLAARLADVPQLAEAMAQAGRLLAEMSAHQLPAAEQVESGWQMFQQWRKQWQQLQRLSGQSLPQVFRDSFNQLSTQWQQHCEPLLEAGKKRQRQLRGKLSEIRRLHDSGRYNVIFGLWRSVEQQLANEPVLAQGLDKELEQTRALVLQLTDLQTFIATPRKQALLADLQALINDTHIAVAERSKRVRQIRQIWGSLGRAEASLDTELNSQFDQLIEQAFAPCRAYYAEQDALRAAAVIQRQQIIDALRQLVAEEVSGQALDKALQHWQKQWRSSGQVDKDAHESLKAAYQEQLSLLKARQQHAYSAAAMQKQQLIATATALASQMDNPQALNDVKQLQQTWKQVGFAGPTQDQALWTQFRVQCDAVFARRNEFRQQEAERLALQRQQLAAEFAQLAAVDLTTANQQLLGQQLAAIQQLDTSIDAELQARKQQLLHQIRQQLQSQALQGQQQQYQQLFAALIDPAVTAEQLPAVYRLLFNRQNDTLSRSDLTLAMEWAAGSASPAPELQRRQQVQMLLLSEKLNQGEAVNLTQLLGRWLSHGPVTAEEQPLLQRVQQLFLAHRHG